MFKKFFSGMLSIVFLVIFSPDISAASLKGDYSYGYFTYNKNSNNTVSIISCDKTAQAVSIPATISGMPVAYINSNAFNECDDLISISAEASSEYFSSKGGILYSKDFTKLIRCPEGYQTEKLTINSAVSEINQNAFYGCKNLKKAVLHQSVGNIGKNAFCGTAISCISIPNKECVLGENCLGYDTDGNPQELIIYGRNSSTAKDYADTEFLFTFIFVNDNYSADIDGVVYYYNDSENFRSDNIKITDLNGVAVSVGYSSSPADTFKRYGSVPTQITIYDKNYEIITTVFVRVALPGDINSDGKLNVRDASLIARHLAEKKDFSNFEKFSADFNKDGSANVRDSSLIARKLAGY